MRIQKLLLYTAATRVLVIVTAIAGALHIVSGGASAAALLPAGVSVVFLLIDRVIFGAWVQRDPMGMLDDIKEKGPGEEFYKGGE